MAERPIGVIAGCGRLPIHTAEGIRAAGREVACVGLWHQFDPQLPGLCGQFARAGVAQIGRWIRLLRKWEVQEVVMVGGVDKSRMYDPLHFVHFLPDWRAARLWYRRVKHDRRTDALLRAVAEEIEGEGIRLIDSTRYITRTLAEAGPMGKVKPSKAQLADVEFALPIIRRLGELDIGQALAVKDREVIAVEALEGTDAMIRRAGELCRSGQWVMVKVSKPAQDMRFDVPTVGMKTIEALRQAKAGCLALEVGKVILLDKAELLAAADKYGIAVVGIGGMGVRI
ncbi:MAG: UDP-2,3-diacylglucosamine diphosphatase LpxI [Phycisphaeraceae bacterium]|nr:UDP-2,3-diacylglucosamine diphosphatase LpxI [Phycisphaeraceae bacterium]